jgi:CBS domain-containing protein
MAQTVREIMTRSVVTLPKDASIVEAARLMRDNGIGDVVVTDGDRAEGIVTDRDIVIRAVADGKEPGSVRLDQVVSEDLTAVAPDDPIDRAVQIMRERAIRRLPVVEAGKPVGIVSLGDLAVEHDPGSALADISEEPPDR